MSSCCSTVGGPPKDLAVENLAVRNLCARTATICAGLTAGAIVVPTEAGLPAVEITSAGISGPVGPGGLVGPDGPIGATGPAGATGPTAASAGIGMFYGLTAGTGNDGATDYAATVAPGAEVPFPRDGPLSVISRSTASSFILPTIGTYAVTFKVHTTEPGQLQLTLDGTPLPETTSADMNPTSGGHAIVGNAFITTTVANSVLAVINPAGNTPALTITPANGSSTHANAQSITIQILT